MRRADLNRGWRFCSLTGLSIVLSLVSGQASHSVLPGVWTVLDYIWTTTCRAGFVRSRDWTSWLPNLNRNWAEAYVDGLDPVWGNTASRPNAASAAHQFASGRERETRASNDWFSNTYGPRA
jgi:hypothetical protein